MAFDYILFDLDGTLTDSYEGISNCVKYALAHFGIIEEKEENLKRFIGPPLWKSFNMFYGFPEQKAKQAVEKYRKRYNTLGVYENRLIDGVPQTLDALKKSGKKLYLATSKPLVLAKRVLAYFDIEKYFDYVDGASLDFSFEEKYQIISHVFETCSIPDKQRAVMIGDRSYDIIGAKQYGISSIGVLCGFGSREELSDCGADYICDSFSDILKIIL